MREAATFTIGRSGDKRAVGPLIKALDDRRETVQTLACLGLGQIDDPRVGPALIAGLKDGSKQDAVRAACAYSIGARKVASAVPALLAALDDNRGETQRLAAWALGQLGEAKAAPCQRSDQAGACTGVVGPLIRAYFARAGQPADELVWAIGRVSGAGVAPAQLASVNEYPIRQGKYNHLEAIRALPGSLPKPAPAAKLVSDHADDIASGLAQALGEHRDVIVSALADLDGAQDRLSLGALTPATSDPKAAAALATIAEKIEPQVTAQLASEDPKVRALAVSVLAKMDGGKLKGADAAVGKALADPADQVRTAAMESVVVLAKRRGSAPQTLVAQLAKILASGAWADRRVAALSLGHLGAGGDVNALIKAIADASSFVREAVAVALGQVGGGAEVQTALQTLAKDSVPQVREAATASLGAARR